MTKPLTEVRAYLDDLLRPDSSPDRESNGLVVQGPEQIRRIGAALNTSFRAIEFAAAAEVDLLLVHHAPWSEIDLHLRDQKLSRLAAARIGLYAAHDTLDRAEPCICALAAHTASRFGLPWVALPEAEGITGGGPAPLRYG